MKFLADANIPFLLVERLRADEHEVFWAYMDAPPKTSDDDLIGLAEREGRVVITYDKGFGELLFKQRRRAGVVLIRLRRATLEEMVSIVADLVKRREDLNGLITVIEDDRIRTTPLPQLFEPRGIIRSMTRLTGSHLRVLSSSSDRSQ